jgi:hypothetical protein
MRIIHVITTDKAQGGVSFIESFPVLDEDKVDQVVEKAEAVFLEQAVAARFPTLNATDMDLNQRTLNEVNQCREEAKECLENGHFEENEVVINMTWNVSANVE